MKALTSFIALWNEDIGPEIVDVYPKSDVGDLEKLTSQIFTSYQFLGDSSHKSFRKKLVTIPINRFNRKAKVLFDILTKSEEKEEILPFIVVVLVPDYLADEELKIYDKIMITISDKYLKGKNNVLEMFYEELKKILVSNQEITLKEPDIEISENYSYTAAVEDFQAGVRLFKTRNLDRAYQTLKKVLLKFEQENNKRLIMEVLYIIASLFTQKKNYRVAMETFKRLEELAEELQNQKYLEISIFMQGFSAYKIENYFAAFRKLKKIDIARAKFINKFQILTIKGRILINLEKYDEALEVLLNALKISVNMEKSDTIKKQQSELLYEIGDVNFRIAIKNIKEFGINQFENYKIYFEAALSNFEKATNLLSESRDHEILIQIYEIMGNINEFLKNNEKFLEYYEKALKIAKKYENYRKTIDLFKRIIQKQEQLQMREKNIERLNDFLTNIEKYKFVDLFTTAWMYRQLASSLIAIGKKKEGLSELLKAHDIFGSLKTPVQEELELLNQIVGIYSELNNNEKTVYYKQKINDLTKKFEKISTREPKTYHPMGDVKEIWIFSTVYEIELYSYCPETKIDNDLLGKFLMALQNFSLEISQQQLNNVIIGNDRFVIYKEKGSLYYVLGRADMKILIERIDRILSIIFHRFWKEFSQHVSNARENLEKFQQFTTIIETLDLSLM